MLRLIFIAAACTLFFLQACNPPVRIRPRNVKTGLDSTFYAGIVEDARSVDLRKAQFLAKIKVGDLGVSLDCRYPDVLSYATDRVRSLGGNLLVITEHKRNDVKSKCHLIKGDIYVVPSLEGLEGRIWWHWSRPLQRGDLRGSRDSFPSATLLPLQTAITCRLGGDFFKEAIIRTETIFWCDSTSLPADAQQVPAALRRAQLHFDLAELHARRLKAALVAIGPDLPALSGKFREMTARQQDLLRAEQVKLDAELSSKNANDVLVRWETQTKSELADLVPYEREIEVDLRKKKK
jgi:hypothetical protein